MTIFWSCGTSVDITLLCVAATILQGYCNQLCIIHSAEKKVGYNPNFINIPVWAKIIHIAEKLIREGTNPTFKGTYNWTPTQKKLMYNAKFRKISRSACWAIIHIAEQLLQRCSLQSGWSGFNLTTFPDHKCVSFYYFLHSDCTRSALIAQKLQKFPGGACPQTPLGLVVLSTWLATCIFKATPLLLKKSIPYATNQNFTGGKKLWTVRQS